MPMGLPFWQGKTTFTDAPSRKVVHAAPCSVILSRVDSRIQPSGMLYGTAVPPTGMRASEGSAVALTVASSRIVHETTSLKSSVSLVRISVGLDAVKYGEVPPVGM